MMVCLSFPVFLIAAITDYFDGWFARRHKSVSKFGAFFDPLADKFLTGFAFLGFAVLSIIPLWMALIVIFRDVVTTSMRFLPDSKGKSLVTSRSAKYKTFVQMIFIIFVLTLLFLHKCKFDFFSQDKILNLIYSDFVYSFMLATVFLSLMTLIDYTKSYFGNKQS